MNPGMHTDWIRSSNGLPCEGQQIEFVLDHRNVAMEGTYTRQAFHSHWAEYTVDRVRSWRNQVRECERAAPVRERAGGVLSSVARPVKVQETFLPVGRIARAS